MFNLKSKLAVVALAATVSGSASAAIALPSGGNGEFVLSVWDPITETSYTRDLGVTLNQFFSASTTPLTFTADTLLNSFLGGLSATSRGALLWSVVNTGDSLIFSDQRTNPQTGASLGTGSGQRYLMTASTPFQALPNGQIPNLSATTYFAAVNGLTPAGVANGSIVTSRTANAQAYAGFLGGDWSGRLSFNMSAGLGQAMSFWSMVTSAANVSGSNGIALSASHNFGSWSFNNDGNLVYAPVPEPSTYALMLAGLLALGAVARRRVK